MEKLEQALQLLLKLSNKPLFMYVDELKEIAKLIHEVGNSEANPTLLTEDKEGEGQGDLWDELFDHIENTPVDVPWADCIKELKQKFKITRL